MSPGRDCDHGLLAAREQSYSCVMFVGTEVGTVLTAVTANDVDTNPALTYSFAQDNDEESLSVFSVDRFSGKVILKKRLDYEARQEYQLHISASDTAHTANTMLTIRITDINDNTPVFQQPAYYALLPGKNDCTRISKIH